MQYSFADAHKGSFIETAKRGPEIPTLSVNGSSVHSDRGTRSSGTESICRMLEYENEHGHGPYPFGPFEAANGAGP